MDRKSDQAAFDVPKAELPERFPGVVGPAPDEPVRLWLLDKHRAGLLPLIRQVWWRRGVRDHASYTLEIDGEHDAKQSFTRP